MGKLSAMGPRAVYASDPHKSRGRRISSPASGQRSPFQRDKDRIIHSSAFRRLKGKTQVFVAHEGDYYRTRLTHSLEVAQIARAIARMLGLDEDLAEGLALAHDLGHPPFGHSGEDALAARMKDYDGFDHNAQTLRIVDKLEERYPDYDGLNLTWETLEGIAKHNGPLIKPGQNAADLPWALTALDDWQRLELDTYAGPEAQVAAIADDIAYNNHDLDDGLRAGLFTVEQISEVPLIGRVFAGVRKTYPDISESRAIHQAVRELIGIMVSDVVDETRRRLEDYQPKSADDIRGLSGPVAAFSDKFRAEEAPLRDFLFKNMYRHYKVNRMMGQASHIVGELFDRFLENPNILPTEYYAKCQAQNNQGQNNQGQNNQRRNENATARVICDYIAGMTDAYALAEHEKIFSVHGYL